MPAKETRPIHVEAVDSKTGVRTPMVINVPVGDIEELTDWQREIWIDLRSAANWKYPTKAYNTDNRDRADKVAAMLDFYTGGHELTEEDGIFQVESLGYYHFIGA